MTPPAGWYVAEIGGDRHFWSGDEWIQTEADPEPEIEFPTRRELARIMRNPASAEGQVHMVWGQVKQFDYATGPELLRADISADLAWEYGYFTGENCILTGDADAFQDLMEDDVFIAVVEVGGDLSYQSTFGADTGAPWFKVQAIKPMDVPRE